MAAVVSGRVLRVETGDLGLDIHSHTPILRDSDRPRLWFWHDADYDGRTTLGGGTHVGLMGLHSE